MQERSPLEPPRSMTKPIAERRQKDSFWVINILIEGAEMEDAVRGCAGEAEDEASKERKGAKTTKKKFCGYDLISAKMCMCLE